MAFVNAITSSTVQGNKRVVYGTATNGSTDSGGDVVTGLDKIDHISFECTSHLNTAKPKVTISGGTATIVTSNGADFIWKAEGV